jgi:hypothetical protein
MAERIDIIVQAQQRAAAGIAAGGGGLAGIAGGGGSVPLPPNQQWNTFRGTLQGVQVAFQAVVGAAAVQQVIAFGRASAQAFLQFERANQTAKLLSGTTEQYNKLLALARQNQRLFGGSLAENIQGLSGFANMARKSGIELAQFNDLSQRLNLLSPEQGLEGAAIALREALAGDTLSLRERFELDKRALAGLTDASLTAADRVRLLNDILLDQGVAAGAAAQTVTETQKAYNALGAELDSLQLSAGQGIAETFDDAARGLARLIGLVNQNPQAIAELRSLLGGGQPVNLVQVEAEMQRDRARESFGLYGRGVSTEGVTERAFAGDEDQFNQAFSRTAVLLARGNEEAQAAVIELNNELIRGETIGWDYWAALQAIEQQAYATADAEGEVGDATTAASNEVAQLAAQRLLQAANSDRAARVEDELRAAIEQSIASGEDVPRIVARIAQAYRIEQGIVAELAAEYQLLNYQRAGPSAGAAGGIGSNIVGAGAASSVFRTRVAAARYYAGPAQAAASTGGSRALSEAQRAREAAAREEERRIEEARRNAERLEEITRDHYQRLRQIQEDYLLSRERAEEDFQIERQRLLAEGRIYEAQLLEERFAREQRRADEDNARAALRQREDYGQRVADLGPVAQGPAGPASGVVAATGSAAPAPAAGGGDAGRALRIEVLLDGQVIGTAAYPTIEALFAADLVRVDATQAPGAGQSAGVSGPRP